MTVILAPGFVQECQSSGTVSYFWYRQTLNITSDVSNTGTIQWKLFLCLVACWTTVYLCVIRGIESTGKVSRTACRLRVRSFVCQTCFLD